MKKIFLILTALVLTANSFAIDYKEYYRIVNGQIKVAKAELKEIQKGLKADKNNITLNKQVSNKLTELNMLTEHKNAIKAAEAKNKELIKKNKAFNKVKADLLTTKQEAADCDSAVVNIFKQNLK